MLTLLKTSETALSPGNGDSASIELSDLSPADQALVLLAANGPALGGTLLETSDYNAATLWTERLRLLRQAIGLSSQVQRVVINSAYEQLVGGVDVMRSLTASKSVMFPSILANAHDSLLVIPMAERQRDENLRAICHALDSGHLPAGELTGLPTEQTGEDARSANHPLPASFCALAQVHSKEDQAVSTALLDRLAFFVDPAQMGLLDLSFEDNQASSDPSISIFARALQAMKLRHVTLPTSQLKTICEASAACGIASMRPSIHCANVARKSAALAGRTEVDDTDVSVAIELCFMWRASVPAESKQPNDNSEKTDDDQEANVDSELDASHNAPPNGPEDKVDEADELERQNNNDKDNSPQAPEQSSDDTLVVPLPEKLLSSIARQQNNSVGKRTTGGRFGRKNQLAQRGMLIGTERYRKGGGQKINVLATLKAAVPWQAQRRLNDASKAIIIKPHDVRASRYKQVTQTVVIVAVDASGSAAAHRLSEAKGAVEQLLSEAYVRRDQVALIAFQGATATMLLPPTRSLARARRELVQLPSGGGTPLPSALVMVKELAARITQAGHSPLLCLLTDGRANVDRDGIGGRTRATQQAMDLARELAAQRLRGVVIDIAKRAHPIASELAVAMGATYMALPKANAKRISEAVRETQSRDQALRCG